MILRYGIRGIFQIDKRSNVREDASIGDRRRSGKLIGRLNEAEKDWVRYLAQWPLPAAMVCRGIGRQLCREPWDWVGLTLAWWPSIILHPHCSSENL